MAVAYPLLRAIVLGLGGKQYYAVPLLIVLPSSALGVPMALNKEQGEQVGRPTLADAARDGWSAIPKAARAHAVLSAQNYGEAGPLDRCGPARGLPKPYSGHMSHADRGPPPDAADGPVLLVRQRNADAIELCQPDSARLRELGSGCGPRVKLPRSDPNHLRPIIV